jgi:diaminopimelate decarboxylase
LEITSLNESKLGSENTGSDCWCLEMSDREKEIDETEEETGCVNAWISMSGGDSGGGG